MKKLASVSLLFLLLLSSVQAKILVQTYSLDYVTSSTEEGLKVCSCASKTDRFRIANIGDFNAAYRVGVRSEVKDWFGFSDLTFALNVGEKKDVGVFMNVPCDAVPGQYEYTVQVASNHDGMKEISRPFQVVHCQNLGFEISPSKLYAKPCNPAAFQAHIQNVGLFDDRFTLSSSDKVSFSEPSVLLKPQEDRIIYGYYAVSCDAKGSEDIPITLSSQNNALSSTKNLEVAVEQPAFDWTLTADKQLSLCAEVPQKVDMTLAASDAPLDYGFSISGVDFASVEPSNGHLDRNAQDKASIVFHPSNKDIGSYDLSLSLSSNYGEETKNFKVAVENCRDFVASFTDVPNKLCCGEKQLTLNIRNKGSATETFQAFSSDVKFISSSITLRPGENGNLQVVWNAPCEDLDALIRVTVVPKSKPELSRDITLPIRSLSEESCYQVGIQDEHLELGKDQDTLNVKVKNLGIEPAMYSLKLSSPFLKLPFVDLFLEPGQAKEVPLKVTALAGYEPGNYLADIIFSPKDHTVQYVESLQISLDGGHTLKLFKSAKTIIALVVVLLLLITVQLVAMYLGTRKVKKKYSQ